MRDKAMIGQRWQGLQALAAALGLLLALYAPVGATAPEPQKAQALVKEVTDRLLAVLRAEAGDGDGDVQQLQRKIDEIVTPNLDFITMTKLAVGRYWRQASDDQKRALVRQFRELLIRTYAQALNAYNDQELKLLPLRPSPHEDRVTVRSRVVQANGPTIPVNYSLRFDDGEWSVYDIVVDGVSLVTNYRSTFSGQIASEGIDGLIQRLKKKNANNATLQTDS